MSAEHKLPTRPRPNRRRRTQVPTASPAVTERKSITSMVTSVFGSPLILGAVFATAMVGMANYMGAFDPTTKKKKAKPKSPYEDYLSYRYDEEEDEIETYSSKPPSVPRHHSRTKLTEDVQEERKESRSSFDVTRLEGLHIEPEAQHIVSELYPLSKRSPKAFKHFVQSLTSFFRREEVLRTNQASADFDDNVNAREDVRRAKHAFDKIQQINEFAGTRRQFRQLRDRLEEILDNHMVNINSMTRTISQSKRTA